MDSQLLTELETIQTRILDRISKLELSHLSKTFSSSMSLSSYSSPLPEPNTTSDGEESSIVSRLSAILRSIGVKDFCFKRVPRDYYDRSLEERRDILGAHSIDHLCKSIVMVNTQAPSDVVDCSNPNNSKYYVIVVQYIARLNAEAIKNYLYSLNNGKVPKKKFNMRLAPEEASLMLTGFEHNAVTCIGMKTEIPVILDEAIVKLSPDFFWLGGGEVDLKLGIKTSEFINSIKPFTVNCSS